mgnify:CR=1 FL=1
MNKGDLVKINTFDDGNQIYKNETNLWKIEGFRFNKSKVSIKNTVTNVIIKSISSWKLIKVDDIWKKLPE